MLNWEKELKKLKATSEDEFDNGICECVEQLMQTFLAQQHSGLSANTVLKMFDRLAHFMPLTAITDEDFVISEDEITPHSYSSPEELAERNLKDEIQCLRYTALFKRVNLDDSVTYTDVNRVICHDGAGAAYTCGLERNIVDQMYPIELPYFPGSNKYEVYVEEYCVEGMEGDFNVKHLDYLITPGGKYVPIARWFGEMEDGNMREITGDVDGYLHGRKMFSAYEKTDNAQEAIDTIVKPFMAQHPEFKW